MTARIARGGGAARSAPRGGGKGRGSSRSVNTRRASKQSMLGEFGFAPGTGRKIGGVRVTARLPLAPAEHG